MLNIALLCYVEYGVVGKEGWCLDGLVPIIVPCALCPVPLQCVKYYPTSPIPGAWFGHLTQITCRLTIAQTNTDAITTTAALYLLSNPSYIRL